jgi:surface antigen
MLKSIKATATATAIAIVGLSVVSFAAAPAGAGGYDRGQRYSKTVHITKKVIYQRDSRRGKRWNRRYNGPPRWAPAYGYRWKKRDRRTYRRRPVRYVVSRTVYVAPRHTGYVYTDRTVAGGLIGAALGALTGSHIGKGSGRTAAIVGGAVIGAIVGGNIGQGMDRTDAVYASRALETAPSGNPVTWTNPDSGNRYTVTPTRTYRNAGGQYCREFTTWGWIGGYEQQLHGTACRMADGSWKNVS